MAMTPWKTGPRRQRGQRWQSAAQNFEGAAGVMACTPSALDRTCYCCSQFDECDTGSRLPPPSSDLVGMPAVLPGPISSRPAAIAEVSCADLTGPPGATAMREPHLPTV